LRPRIGQIGQAIVTHVCGGDPEVIGCGWLEVCARKLQPLLQILSRHFTIDEKHAKRVRCRPSQKFAAGCHSKADAMAY
jgi:hypothetical protein